jgi:hypothetical protein
MEEHGMHEPLCLMLSIWIGTEFYQVFLSSNSKTPVIID